MEHEGIPVVRIKHIESGQEITLDPKAAKTLALNIEVALENLGDQEVFLKAAAAGTVLGGGTLLITNEHGAVAAPLAAWLVRMITARLLGATVGGLVILTNAARFRMSSASTDRLAKPSISHHDRVDPRRRARCPPAPARRALAHKPEARATADFDVGRVN
jgi:hypothetical protein